MPLPIGIPARQSITSNIDVEDLQRMTGQRQSDADGGLTALYSITQSNMTGARTSTMPDVGP